jgi:hypothetical protein
MTWFLWAAVGLNLVGAANNMRLGLRLKRSCREVDAMAATLQADIMRGH